MSQRAKASVFSFGAAGTTLVEALVAVGMFGLAAMALTGLMMGAIRTSSLAQDLGTAKYLATHRLEQIKTARYLDGNSDGWLDAATPCDDIDEVTAANFFDENYGQIDLLNGTQFTYDGTCAAVKRIKRSGVQITQASYPGGVQGQFDYEVNHAQFTKFRREVYIYSSASQPANAIRNVTLDGPRAAARDNIIVDAITPDATYAQTNYTKYVFVRVKWKDSHGQLHHVTLSTTKVYRTPAS